MAICADSACRTPDKNLDSSEIKFMSIMYIEIKENPKW